MNGNFLTSPLATIEYQILWYFKSGAGFYIGTMMWIDEGDAWGPYTDHGSKDSEYFSTRAQAEEALKSGFELRIAPENEFARATGILSSLLKEVI